MRQISRELLSSHVWPSDGSIGTELQRMGLEPGALTELWNLEHPDEVRALHQSYLDAGAQFLTTNSFRANRFGLRLYSMEEQLVALNRSAASLAREVARDRAWVMGSMGPLGALLRPVGEISSDEASDWLLEQAKALISGGVDILLLETMSAVEEMEIGIRSARATGCPLVFATMTFAKSKHGYRTMMGVSPEEAALAIDRAGADVIGCNCGTDLEMEDHVAIVRAMRGSSSKPILVQPNAGQPELVNNEIVYRRPASAMASRVPDLISAGANIIGGCCGTTPEHIRLFSQIIRES